MVSAAAVRTKLLKIGVFLTERLAEVVDNVNEQTDDYRKDYFCEKKRQDSRKLVGVRKQNGDSLVRGRDENSGESAHSDEFSAVKIRSRNGKSALRYAAEQCACNRADKTTAARLFQYIFKMFACLMLDKFHQKECEKKEGYHFSRIDERIKDNIERIKVAVSLCVELGKFICDGNCCYCCIRKVHLFSPNYSKT